MVLEHAGPLTALRRSARLVRGNWWRVFGIGLLTAIIMSLASGLLTAPLAILAGTLTKTPAMRLSPPSSSAPRAGCWPTLTTTVAAGVLVLLYVDLPMRKEGLDRRLQAAAQHPGDIGVQFAVLAGSAQRVEDGAV